MKMPAHAGILVLGRGTSASSGPTDRDTVDEKFSVDALTMGHLGHRKTGATLLQPRLDQYVERLRRQSQHRSRDDEIGAFALTIDDIFKCGHGRNASQIGWACIIARDALRGRQIACGSIYLSIDPTGPFSRRQQHAPHPTGVPYINEKRN